MTTAIDYGLGVDTDKDILEQIVRTDRSMRSGNCAESYPVVMVEIPPSVLIDCPLVRPAKIRALECRACQHFKGIVQVAWSDDSPLTWDQKYAITCGKPLDRKCTSIVTLGNSE